MTLPRSTRPPPGPPPFNDPAWTEQFSWVLLRQLYMLGRHHLLELGDAAWLPAHRRPPVRFLAQALVDTAAPTNFLLTNPAALRHAWDTRGASLARGIRNFTEDVLTRNGRPSRMPPGSFRLGTDLAATPGRVVYRNDVLEVLQYSPRTQHVHEAPLLLIPAWVNKYYIYDLAPGRSLVEWAVGQGFTVFCVSARDHSTSTLDVDIETYVTHGLLVAFEVVRELCAAPRVHLVGVCSGGLFATALAAWLEKTGKAEAATLTLLASALTLPEPADQVLSAAGMRDSEIRALARLLARDRRCINGRRLAMLFDLMRGESLLWEPLTSGWLRGERPSAGDLSAWNEDTLDIPRRLFIEFLQLLASESIARGQLRVAGETLHPGQLTIDTFAVAAQQDHIVPWDIAYRSTLLLGGEHTFCLVPSGHMGVVVNPPRRGARYLTSREAPATSGQWRESAAQVSGSWWQLWTDWLAERSGNRVPARPPQELPGIDNNQAPGMYVTHGWPPRFVHPPADVPGPGL
ncbi:alpha/beta fold hydrolase [Streptomyces sp. NPDC051577]|uniref:PHA/PHB synthase family protein n=1 Tax=Streptomyces sp. NPDC051577 TaxID=3155166 RepID=UPI0034149463